MKNMLSDFEKEQNQVLEFILNERFFKTWQNGPDYSTGNMDKGLWGDTQLELYLTSHCNQKCEYCYLHKYDLYPQEYDKPEIILKNLEIIYNWIIDNQYHIPTIEFFSGEIWHSQFGLNVLELSYQYLLKGMKIDCFSIPSNCSFILNDAQTRKIQKYIDKFRENNSCLQFSISIDGPCLDPVERPLNNGTTRDDEYYNKLFTFAYHNTFYFHPMFSAQSAKYWIENYQWWMNKLKEYDMPREAVMILEVRNNEWTEENLKDYEKFLDYSMDETLKIYHNNVKNYIMSYFDNDYMLPGEREGYSPTSIGPAELYPGCSIDQMLTIRVGDLALCPCHRTAYNKLLYGWLETENDKIVGVKQNNIYNAIRVLLTNNQAGHIKCDTCVYAPYCLQGCFGCQYENNNDMFMPLENICLLFKTKWQFIIKKLQSIGALDILKKVNAYSPSYSTVVKFLEFAQGVLNDVE